MGLVRPVEAGFRSARSTQRQPPEHAGERTRSTDRSRAPHHASSCACCRLAKCSVSQAKRQSTTIAGARRRTREAAKQAHHASTCRTPSSTDQYRFVSVSPLVSSWRSPLGRVETEKRRGGGRIGRADQPPRRHSAPVRHHRTCRVRIRSRVRPCRLAHLALAPPLAAAASSSLVVCHSVATRPHQQPNNTNGPGGATTSRSTFESPASSPLQPPARVLSPLRGQRAMSSAPVPVYQNASNSAALPPVSRQAHTRATRESSGARIRLLTGFRLPSGAFLFDFRAGRPGRIAPIGCTSSTM